MLYPPLNFSYIEKNVYRSASPTIINFEFIKTLELKTIVALSHEAVDDRLLEFVEDAAIRIEIVPDNVLDGFHVSEELVIEALKYLTCQSYYPILLMCRNGTNKTGVVTGCLRKIQKWSLISIFEEYRRFSGSKMQQHYEQFIELFDTDLVNITNDAPSFLMRT